MRIFRAILTLRTCYSGILRTYWTMADAKKLWGVILTILLLATPTQQVALKVGELIFKEVASFALDNLFNKLLDDETTKKLDDIMESLNTIDTKLTEGLADIEELMKKSRSFDKALEIEAKLRTKIDAYRTILELSKKNGNNQTQDTINYVNRFKEGLSVVPDLLYQLHLLIVGDSTVDAGLFPGLAKSVVQQKIKDMKSATFEVYDVSRTVQEIFKYRYSLMSLQVTSFQLYHSNCPDSFAVCNKKLNVLKDRLTLQYKLFKQLIPRNFDQIRQEKDIMSVFLTDPENNAVLYSNQMSSIVKDGIMDWDKIGTPQDAGLRCPRYESNEKWSLEDASVHGKKGYFLKLDSGCYLSIDRQFITYKMSFPLIWTQSDYIDRYEFLICLPNLTPDAVTFFLFADGPGVNTTYHLKAHHSEITDGRFLHISVKKTSVNEEINRRLVLTLFLTDTSKSWTIGSETSKKTCEDSSLQAAVDGEDNGIVIAIGVGVGVGVLILVIIAICCCCCRKE